MFLGLEKICLLQCPVHLTFDLNFNREHLPPIGSVYVKYGDSRQRASTFKSPETIFLLQYLVCLTFEPQNGHLPPMGSPYV
jgi:hypothetical protein